MDAFGAIAEAARRDWPGMAGIAAAIVVLFVAGEVLRRVGGAPVEYTRKLAHLGGGAVVMTVPWVLSSHWTVLVLCAAFFGLLVAGRVTGQLASVHAVDRSTGGAYFYPFAVYGTYWLAAGDPLLFCVPLAVMAVADTGAAIVGKRAGETRFRVMDGVRSLEGSATFWAIAFALFLGGLALDGRGGWPGVLLVALVGATLTTCIEAISVRGADNLFIPYGAFVVLDRTLRLGLDEMGDWIAGMLVGLVAIVVAWGRMRLMPAGAIAGFLFATLAWAIGGPAWFWPLAALVAVLAVARSRTEETDLEQVFPTLVGSVVALLAFAHEGGDWYAPFLAASAAHGAIALALVGEGRWWVPAAGLVGALVPVVTGRLVDESVPVALLVAAGLSGLCLYAGLRHGPIPGRRLVASACAGLLVWGMMRP
jgi:phytol kinase